MEKKGMGRNRLDLQETTEARAAGPWSVLLGETLLKHADRDVLELTCLLPQGIDNAELPVLRLAPLAHTAALIGFLSACQNKITPI